MARPTKLIYQGKQDEHFIGVPMRDLDERDLAKLSDDRIKEIMGGKRPLYAEAKPTKAEPRRSSSRSSKRKPSGTKATKPEAAPSEQQATEGKAAMVEAAPGEAEADDKKP